MLSARSAMREFVRLLTADGVAIVSVPNCWGHTPHHLSDPDLPFLKSLCNEFFADCEFFYHNSGDLPSQTGAGIGPLEGTNVDEAECLIAVCKQPRPLNRSQDRASEMHSDFYTSAFERHHEFLKLQQRSASLLPVGESDIDTYPSVVVGRPLALALDVDCDCSRVLIRLDAEIIDSLPERVTIAVPAIPLSGPRLAQVQLLSSDGETIASPVVRLVSPEIPAEQSGSCDATSA